MPSPDFSRLSPGLLPHRALRRAWRTAQDRVLLPGAFVLAAPLIAAGGWVAWDWLWTHTHWSLAGLVLAIAMADALFALVAAFVLATERG
jgi:hypothetical protein